MADSVLPRRRNLDHRFFGIAAAAVVIAVLVGFGPTFYLKRFFGDPPVARRGDRGDGRVAIKAEKRHGGRKHA